MTRTFEAASFDADSQKITLIEALIAAMRTHGAGKLIMEDQERNPVDYKTFIQRTIVLSRLIKRAVPDETRLGLMLPTSIGGAMSFYALHALGRVPVMLNFTAGQANIRSGCQTAGVRTVISSRRFIEVAKLGDLVETMSSFVRFVYLEDLRKDLRLGDKLVALAATVRPELFVAKTTPDDIGVILFTSGSFGAPRGVVLSQANLVLNARQISQHIYLSPDWIMFNPMPIFHSLGLTGGVVLPILSGLRSFQYPSPLHVKQIPELVKDTRASVLFSTDTFLNQYARSAEPDSFASLEFVVCGAEKVRDETHNLFRTQFGGLTILEGYGVTEASPVVAVNQPLNNIPGTVGAPLPGLSLRLEPVEGIPVGGRLYLKGPNIMQGYINPDTPDVIEASVDGWHDTGDIVDLDADGHIKILGRAKRFAKIAGEMISLTAVEKLAEEVWPDNRHAVVAVSDDKKGERLILITDNGSADVARLTERARATGTPVIAVPKRILKVAEVPVLGSGKTDYVTLQRLADIESEAA
jgi:acyl-[acyl-carrier-protein]-phospholipid O-acyltransferase / long-chain-fatty-acid--[acyl-carrier-protein] ligase